MIELYVNLPAKYRARLLLGNELIVESISPKNYMRHGTEGLGDSKLEAVEILKKRIMNRFNLEMKAIDWQSRAYFWGRAE